MRTHLDDLHRAHSRNIPLAHKHTGIQVFPNGATMFHDTHGGTYPPEDVAPLCRHQGPRAG